MLLEETSRLGDQCTLTLVQNNDVSVQAIDFLHGLRYGTSVDYVWWTMKTQSISETLPKFEKRP